MPVLSRNLQLLILSFLTIVFVFNPLYLHQQVNLFEWGLYLPGIDGILHGQVPYRDFFYLRGPLELYLPAFLMRIFGENAAVLAAYFYAGTVLTLLTALFIAGEILEIKSFWWLLTPVLVARTFPRVVFTYWGGFRYVWGLLAVYCAVRFFKSRDRNWILAAGMLTAVGGWTSPEIGLSAFAAILAAVSFHGIWLKDAAELLKVLGRFCTGILIMTVPLLAYFESQGALANMGEIIWQVTTSMTKVFLMIPPPPANLQEVFAALINPHNHHFRHLTPAYCYLAFLIYILRQISVKKVSNLDWAATAVAGYGFMIYVTGFRNIEASVFEMSLQPEKIVLFFLLVQLFLALKEKGLRSWAYVLVAAVAVSSLVFSFSHMSKRFFIFQSLRHKHKDSLKHQASMKIELPRIHSMVVPQWQAEDFKQVKSFLDEHTSSHEPVLMFAELGTLSFIVDRPYVGRFASISLSWLKDSWHQELMGDIKRLRPSYAIVNKKFPDYFQTVYFLVGANKEKFDEVLSYIHEHYTVVAQTPSYNIFQRK